MHRKLSIWGRKKYREREREREERTDEESAWKGPFLGAADDGEREPVRGNEGMKKRYRRDSSDCWQIFRAYTSQCHYLSLFSFLLSILSITDFRFLQFLFWATPPHNWTIYVNNNNIYGSKNKYILFWFEIWENWYGVVNLYYFYFYCFYLFLLELRRRGPISYSV